MLKIHLLIAWRNILSQKGFTFINLVGLIAGITTFLLITQHVLYEKNYDTHGENPEDIYRVNLLISNHGIPEYKTALMYPAVGPDLTSSFPEVKNYCRLYSMQSSFTRAVSFKDKSGALQVFNENHVYYTHPEFFELFPFELTGNGYSLSQPFTAILSATTAAKYFGPINPIGKSISFRHSNGEHEYTIVGMADIPVNTHLNISILLSYSSLEYGSLKSSAFNNWDDENAYTYLRLASGTDPKELEDRFDQLIKEKTGQSQDIKFELQRITDIHTSPALLDEPKPTVSAQSLQFLFIGGCLLLIISIINYVNILLGNALKRKKDVYLGLINGATRWQMFHTFMIQFLMLSFFGLIIALLASFAIIDVDLFSLPYTILLLLYASIITLLIISGAYPSYLITFRRKNIDANKSQSITGLSLGLQFFICIGLIISTLVVNRQLDFVKNKDLGFNADNLLVIKGPASKDFADSVAAIHNESFKNELLNNPQIKQVTYSGIIPGMENSWITEAKIDPKTNKSVDVSFNIIDDNFPETFEIQLLAGRAFNSSDQRNGRFGERIESVMLNRTAAQSLGLTNYAESIGKQLVIFNKNCKLVGIVKDFHQQSLHHTVYPAAYFLDKNASLYFSVRLNKEADGETIDQIKKTYTQFFPNNPFEHFMMDEFFYAQYESEKTFFQLFTYLSGISILISCLGLLSISFQYSTRRVKEIGIRKVNGANLTEILILLNKDFMKWILIAFIIAIPIAWYAMDQWLQNFAYQTELSCWIFAVAGLLALCVALLTVSWQSWKAATRNPVEALRYE